MILPEGIVRTENTILIWTSSSSNFATLGFPCETKIISPQFQSLIRKEEEEPLRISYLDQLFRFLRTEMEHKIR